MTRMRAKTGTNYLYNMIYQISLIILPVITSPFLSRVIGSEGLGNYSYAYSVAYYFFLFGMLGINNYGNRSIAAIRDNKKDLNYTFSRIYYFQIIISGLATILYIAYCAIFCKTNKELAFAQTLYVVSAVLNINWFFFGIEEFKITVIRKTAIKLITSICIFVFIRSPRQLLLYTLILVIAELLGEAYLWVYLPKYIRFVKVRLKDVFKGTKEIVVLFIPIVATSIYRYMDKIMIGQLWTMDGVGQYDYAEKIIMVCLGCMTALGTVMLPKMAYLIANHENKKVHRHLRNSMQFAMFIGFAIAFGLVAIGYRLSILYYGVSYMQCGKVLTMLSITVIPIAWANVLRTQYLIPGAKDRQYVISVVAGAIINFILNYTLIPKWGLKGAVIGTIAAEYCVAILQTIMVRKELNILEYVKCSMPFMLIGIVMFMCTSYVGTITTGSFLGLILQIIIGGIVYIGLSIVYCKKTKNELYQYVVSYLTRGEKQ